VALKRLRMTQLKPFDILVIQTAIEEYERKYPRRPTPSAEEALAWRLRRRDRRRKQGQLGVTAERRPLRIYERFRAWWKRTEQSPPSDARLYRPDGTLR
jgi:hypothetical protein